MQQLDLLIQTSQRLREAGFSHFVTGSVASTYYGEYRFTYDIDIVIKLRFGDDRKLCALFPLSEFYISDIAVRSAIQHRSMFNAIHHETGIKIDFMVAPDSIYNQTRFTRYRDQQIDDDHTVPFSSPEDVILMKLCSYRESGGDRHPRDIVSMFITWPETIERDYITLWAERLGVSEQWQMIQAKVKAWEDSVGEPPF